MSYSPHYTTTYGEDHGYNSRRGGNGPRNEFRQRYLNPMSSTPPVRNGTREEFKPRGNPYGPYDGISRPSRSQTQRPNTVPANAGSQIMAPEQSYQPRTQNFQRQNFNQTQPTQPGQAYDGYLPKSFSIVDYRPRTPPLSRPGLARDFQESQQNFGKYSISRRLPDRERLRYHVPGYMGFVKNIQFLHGDTYGRTTRKCILAPGVAES